MLRGRARMQGANQVFSGPFIILASKQKQVIRADFCGPDGSPAISILADSSGVLVYSPDEADAVFFPGGIPAGNGLLGVNALFSLLRTGFPVVPVQWEMANCCDTLNQSGLLWTFSSQNSGVLEVLLGAGQLFPSISTDEMELRVTATSWHDSFNAWPLEWSLVSPSMSVILRIRTIGTEDEPSETALILNVPVPIDTLLQTSGEWFYSFPVPIR
jgi:hypothetical protein